MAIYFDGNATVRDAVGRYPQTRAVFEKHGIDYCCGGAVRLAEAAAGRGLDLSSLLAELQTARETAPDPASPPERDWYAAPLGELIGHILAVHHAYMKTALPRLRVLVPTVRNAHEEQHGDMLRRVEAIFNALDAEISSHLMKEEQVLFPYMTDLEAHVREGAPAPAACFASARYPIRQMEHEHESAGRALAELREVTGGYALPADACPTFAAMYEELQRMEADLHRHIHLENNILFPRAVEMETQVRGEG